MAHSQGSQGFPRIEQQLVRQGHFADVLGWVGGWGSTVLHTLPLLRGRAEVARRLGVALAACPEVPEALPPLGLL